MLGASCANAARNWNIRLTHQCHQPHLIQRNLSLGLLRLLSSSANQNFSSSREAQLVFDRKTSEPLSPISPFPLFLLFLALRFNVSSSISRVRTLFPFACWKNSDPRRGSFWFLESSFELGLVLIWGFVCFVMPWLFWWTNKGVCSVLLWFCVQDSPSWVDRSPDSVWPRRRNPKDFTKFGGEVMWVLLSLLFFFMGLFWIHHLIQRLGFEIVFDDVSLPFTLSLQLIDVVQVQLHDSVYELRTWMENLSCISECFSFVWYSCE